MANLNEDFNVFDKYNFQGVATKKDNPLLVKDYVIAGNMVIINKNKETFFGTNEYSLEIIPQSIGRYSGVTDFEKKPIFEHDEVEVEWEQELWENSKAVYVDCKAVGYVVFHDCKFVVWLENFSIKSPTHGLLPEKVVELTNLSKDEEQKIKFKVIGNKYLKK